jgi:hypothetical protein
MLAQVHAGMVGREPADEGCHAIFGGPHKCPADPMIRARLETRTFTPESGDLFRVHDFSLSGRSTMGKRFPKSSRRYSARRQGSPSAAAACEPADSACETGDVSEGC